MTTEMPDISRLEQLLEQLKQTPYDELTIALCLSWLRDCTPELLATLRQQQAINEGLCRRLIAYGIDPDNIERDLRQQQERIEALRIILRELKQEAYSSIDWQVKVPTRIKKLVDAALAAQEPLPSRIPPIVARSEPPEPPEKRE